MQNWQVIREVDCCHVICATLILRCSGEFLHLQTQGCVYDRPNDLSLLYAILQQAISVLTAVPATSCRACAAAIVFLLLTSRVYSFHSLCLWAVWQLMMMPCRIRSSIDFAVGEMFLTAAVGFPSNCCDINYDGCSINSYSIFL